jgi:hypothetical protein
MAIASRSRGRPGDTPWAGGGRVQAAGAIDVRRIGDVLELLLPKVDNLGGDRSACMAPRLCGDADAARWGKTFETHREVDAVAINVVRRDDNVTEIDADAQFDAPGR